MNYISSINDISASKVIKINNTPYKKVDYIQKETTVAERKNKVIIPTVHFGILEADNDVTIIDSHILYDHSAEVEGTIWNV